MNHVFSLLILAMPWRVPFTSRITRPSSNALLSRVPPKSGRYGGNVSFWYGTASATGIGILVVCFIYWSALDFFFTRLYRSLIFYGRPRYVWARTLPKVFHYTICEEITKGDNGELSKRFVRVYNDERGDQWRKEQAERASENDAKSAEDVLSSKHDEKDEKDSRRVSLPPA